MKESNSEHKDNKESIVQALQNSNRILRQRALIITFLLIAVFGMSKSYEKQQDENMKLFDLVMRLEKMRDTTDLKTYIELNDYAIEMEFMHSPIDAEGLIYYLKQSDYTDRTPIVEALTTVTAERTKLFKNDSSINILGINLQVQFLSYFLPFILAFLFHDFTHVIHFRRELIDKFKKIGIEPYEYGVDFLTYNKLGEIGAVNKYLRVISSVMAAGFLLICLIASLLFIGFAVKDSNSPLLIIVSWSSFLVILLDIAIITYEENILKFAWFIDMVTGRRNSSKREHNLKIMLWLLYPIFIGVFHFMLEWELNEGSKMALSYVVTVTAMAVFLSISLWLCNKFPGNKIFVGMRFTGVAVNVFCFLIIVLMLGGWMGYNPSRPSELAQLSIVVFLGGLILSRFYTRSITRS